MFFLLLIIKNEQCILVIKFLYYRVCNDTSEVGTCRLSNLMNSVFSTLELGSYSSTSYK